MMDKPIEVRSFLHILMVLQMQILFCFADLFRTALNNA